MKIKFSTTVLYVTESLTKDDYNIVIGVFISTISLSYLITILLFESRFDVPKSRKK